MKQSIKEYARLAFVTFLQGALAVWAVTGFSINKLNIHLVAGGGVAALASLVYNMLRPSQKTIEAALIGAEYPAQPKVIDPDAMGFMGDEGLPHDAKEDD